MLAPLVGFALFAVGVALEILSPLWQTLETHWLTIIIVAVSLSLIVSVVMARLEDDWGVVFPVMLGAIALGGLVVHSSMPAFNAWLDGSAAKLHVVKVHEAMPRQKGIRQRIVVESWRVAGEEETLYVADAIFDKPPRRVQVTTREGFFGWPWVETVIALPE